MKYHFKKIPFFAILAVICFIFAGISFIHPVKQIQKQTQVKKIAATPTLPTVPTNTKTENSIITSTPTSSTTKATSAPTTTPIPVSQTQQNTQSPTETPTPQKTANLTINEPDGSATYQINISGTTNPCSLLSLARDQGKIKSVTIKTYGPPLNSGYVQEVNSYQNNWTFSLNGTSEPSGCSNYTVNPNDTVLWKFN